MTWEQDVIAWAARAQIARTEAAIRRAARARAKTKRHATREAWIRKEHDSGVS